MNAAVANRLWYFRALGAWQAFRCASGNPRATQMRRMRAILRANAESEYGIRHRFREIRTVGEFRERVPVVRYDDLAPEVAAIRKGRKGVLTAEPVLLLQPSSGSTAATKLIPYTASLRRQLNRAVSVWIGDLFWHRPELMDGPAYWSISPLPQSRTEGPGPVPVGFDDDTAYLSGIARALVSSVLAVPGEVGLLSDPVAHRYATLRYLLGEGELRLVSVWSPTFLSLLLEPLSAWWEQLVEDVDRGGMTPLKGEPAAKGAGTSLPLPPPNPARARELRAVGPEDLAGLWPRLGLLSAWGDGASAPYADVLRGGFPGVSFQPKGLIATEAFVTIPRWDQTGAHPAITSHFLEFIPEGCGPEDARLVDELDGEGRYEVLVTTGGGFYRYRLGDLVEVVGYREGLPCLRFAGRADKVSDRFGEKLSDGFVSRVLHELCQEEGLAPGFSMLAPEVVGGGVRYVWYLDSGRVETGVSTRLDRRLSQNFHYAACRRLGQLGEAAIRIVSPDTSLRYLEANGGRARRLGDVKIPALETEVEWGERLRGGRPTPR